jgi:serine/threonine protein kinase
LRENIGSPLFMPYESLVNNFYGYKSDIWAIGITFLEMITGKVPWRSKTEKELIVELKNLRI